MSETTSEWAPQGGTDAVMPPIACSVNILTRNSAASLPRALESVREFAEIVVCDGGSSDSTVQIALNAGCTVIKQSAEFLDDSGWLIDYSGPRNQMLRSSNHKWVFQLDSDEYASPELVQKIGEICNADPDSSIFKIGAKYELNNQLIECASNYPIWHRRLFNREQVGGFQGAVNENVAGEVSPHLIEEYFVIPLPELSLLLRKWIHYLGISFSRYRDACISDRLSARRGARSSIRWFLRNLKQSLSNCEGRRLPVRYEAARFCYHLTNYAGYRLIDMRHSCRELEVRLRRPRGGS